jgi:hypothetical protein
MMMADLTTWIDSGVGVLGLIVSILLLVGAQVAAIVAASRWVGTVNTWMQGMDRSITKMANDVANVRSMEAAISHLAEEVGTLRKYKHDHANFIGSAGWRLDIVEAQSERNTAVISDIRVQLRDLDGLPSRLREIDDRLGRIESRLERDR